MVENTRRTFLEVASALGAIGVTGVGAAQEDGDADIELGGRTSGWEGIQPGEIEGETNPPLELVAGEDYVLVWENLDGQGHNFAIETEGGEDLVSSDYASNGSVTVEFTASEEMHEYYCEPHPSTMRGPIEIVEGDGGDEADDGEDETGDGQDEAFAAAVDELFELALDEDGWHGEAPDDIEGEENPTLSVLPGEAYVIGFENRVGVNGDIGPDDVDGDDDAAENETDGGTSATNETDDGAGAATNETDDGAGAATNETDTDTDDEDPEAGDEVIHEEGSNLALVDEDGEEIVATELLDPEERGAVAFVADETVAGYRDDSTNAEGTIEIAEDPAGDEGDASDGDDGTGADDGDGGDESGADDGDGGDGADADDGTD